MNNSNQSTCPKCNAAIPEDAPDGLCPKCALESAATASTRAMGAGITPPPSIDELAPHFPDLEIIELLGAGGMGAVYQARQPQLDRFVALKILSHHLAGDPAFVERFNREAKVLGRLSHPNIVGIHDFGTAGPYCYLLMEYVDGVNLRQAMRAGRFTPSEALAMVQHLCSALKFAHEEGILHRDIKPENILIDSKGRVKVADFGIAKLVGEDRQQDVTLTMQGSVLGSPHYMAPEQIETPGDVDQRADIYSLGVVLYEMLTGGLPIGRFALPSEKAEMDARIDHIVMRTLEKEREARYQSAGEVQTSVDELKNPAALPHPPLSVDSPAARFSLASAFLTGSSIVLSVVVPVLLFFGMQPVPAGEGDGGTWVASIFTILLLIAAPASALTGFIFGARALGEIRRSGGAKSGLGSAIFATTAWPILILFGLAALPTAFAPGDSTWILIPLILIAGTISAIVLVRGVARWAGGAEVRQSGRRHLGLGMSLLRALVMATVLPLSGLWIISAFSGKGGNSLDAQQSAQDVAATAALSQEVSWRRSKPEVLVPITTQPGQRATLRLLLQDGDGNAKEFPLGDFHAKPNHPRQHGVLKVGTRLEGTKYLMSVVLRTNERARISRTEEDLRGWEFDGKLPDELTFASMGRYEFQLATLREDGQDTPTGILTLEVVVTPPSPVEKLTESF